MKKDIHPQGHRDIIFVDDSSGERFLISSTLKTEKNEKWTDGKEYPAVHVEISSASHPFYTGRENIVDTAGRVEKFKTRASKSDKSKKA
jgi:large subunit ribosomal protein L31